MIHTLEAIRVTNGTVFSFADLIKRKASLMPAGEPGDEDWIIPQGRIYIVRFPDQALVTYFVTLRKRPEADVARERVEDGRAAWGQFLLDEATWLAAHKSARRASSGITAPEFDDALRRPRVTQHTPAVDENSYVLGSSAKLYLDYTTSPHAWLTQDSRFPDKKL